MDLPKVDSKPSSTGTSYMKSLNSVKFESTPLTNQNVRRIGLETAPTVMKFIDSYTKSLFGDVDVKTLLYERFISIGAYTDTGKLVAMMAFDGFPNILTVPSWSWTKWFRNLYGVHRISAFNSLWIHMMASERQYMFDFVRVMLEFKFRRLKYLKYVMLLVPPGVGPVDCIARLATRIFPLGFSNAKTVQTVYLFMRETFTNIYKVRRAVEEDNDDLVPLIDKHNERFQKLYGEFYVAELLTTHQDSGRHLIVTEYKGYACSVVGLNEVVNYQELNEEFELMPFNGLKKESERCFEYDEEIEGEDSIEAICPGERVEDEEVRMYRTKSGASAAGTLSSESLEQSPESVEEEDDYDIVNVSSIALVDILHYDTEVGDDEEESLSEHSINAQFNELCTQMLTQRVRGKKENVELETSYAESVKRLRDMLPEYYGEDNAFTLEIAVAPKEHVLSAITMLLEAAFECFPDRDYCVLTIPSNCCDHDIVRSFSHVAHRPYGSFPHELYVLHRNAISGRMRVYRYSYLDMYRVRAFMQRQSRPGRILHQVESIAKGDTRYMAFLMTCEDVIVGLAVVTEDLDLDQLYYHYEFWPFIDRDLQINGSWGLIESLILSPIFEPHGAFFLREIHRIADLSLLFYKLTPADIASTEPKDRPIMNVLTFMIPLVPRPILYYDLQYLHDWMPDEKVLRLGPPASVFLSTTRTVSMRRIYITERIVVIGGSDAAISFLESLFVSRNMSSLALFTNVTLVSPHGLPYQKTLRRVKRKFFVSNLNLDQSHMDRFPLKFYVNVVQGVMTSIDRRNQYIMINDESYLPYDLLFLMCGEQFQIPILPSDPFTGTLDAANAFVINTVNDATTLMYRLKPDKTRFNRSLPVIIYGHTLEAYCAIAALMEFGIEGKDLILIDPFPEIDLDPDNEQLAVSIFNDAEVDEAMVEALKAEMVTVYESFKLVDWLWDKDSNLITRVQFESKHRYLDLECRAILLYDMKSVSHSTFMAIIRAGLVFDGRLVIDPECRTNDPRIYGCGPMTKYSRQYYADHMTHRFFNTVEVGRVLGKQIRQMLLPVDFSEDSDAELIVQRPKNPHLVPRYEDPVITFCVLPGNLQYLSVRKPGKVIPLEIAMTTGDYGLALVTGKAKELAKQGYFRLHVNQYRTVETITCLSTDPIDAHNIKAIYGKHEKLLNNLVIRFEKVMVPDLFQFFKEPWCYAIYHNHFPGFIRQLQDICTGKTYDHIGIPLLQNIFEKFSINDWNQFGSEEKEDIDQILQGSGIRRLIENAVLEYLQDNDAHLPMFATPMFIRLLLQEYQGSPMFLPE